MVSPNSRGRYAEGSDKTNPKTNLNNFPHKPNVADKTQPNTNTQQTNTDSIVKACFSNELVKDLFGGKLVHLSFDCPENLRDAFKTEVKRNAQSVCQTLRNFMISYIIASRLKACFPNTISPTVRVERLVTPVFVKGRVRRYGGGVVYGGERFYCGLKDSHVSRDSLPLLECSGCPNRACRSFVFGGVKVE